MDPTPAQDERDQDRAEPKPNKQKTSGFKWKEKQAADSADGRPRASEGGLQRGYRDRSPRRDSSYRERDRDGRDERERPRDRQGDRYRERSPPPEPARDDGTAADDGPVDPPIARPGRSAELSESTADKFGLPSGKAKKKDRPKKAPRVVPSEPMIVVNVNDRLGTKAAIPCLASDSVKAFKAIVAAHIGRQPHEIMLKRQGERPFKDQLTLEDYGVCSGVQLDLEIDTGD